MKWVITLTDAYVLSVNDFDELYSKWRPVQIWDRWEVVDISVGWDGFGNCFLLQDCNNSWLFYDSHKVMFSFQSEEETVMRKFPEVIIKLPILEVLYYIRNTCQCPPKCGTLRKFSYFNCYTNRIISDVQHNWIKSLKIIKNYVVFLQSLVFEFPS